MKSLTFLFLTVLSGLAAATFPDDSGPLNTGSADYVRQSVVFIGSGSEANAGPTERLEVQRILKVNRTLFIGGRKFTTTTPFPTPINAEVADIICSDDKVAIIDLSSGIIVSERESTKPPAPDCYPVQPFGGKNIHMTKIRLRYGVSQSINLLAATYDLLPEILVDLKVPKVSFTSMRQQLHKRKDRKPSKSQAWARHYLHLS